MVLIPSWSMSSKGRLTDTPVKGVGTGLTLPPEAVPKPFTAGTAPQTRIRLHRMATRRGGIDLGGTKIQAIVVDDDDNVLGQARHPTPKDGGPQGVADGIVAALAEAAADAGVDVSELAGVGIGSPGAIDDDRGTVTQARNVTPDWTGEFALGPAVASASGVTNVRLGHDVAV